jgi:hypothetical protein
LQATIEQMERDLQQITNRLNIVERSVIDVKKITNNNQLQVSVVCSCNLKFSFTLYFWFERGK